MAKKGSRFQRYTYEFKRQVVEDYLSGQSGGMPAVVKKYGLKSTYQISAWVKSTSKPVEFLTSPLIADFCKPSFARLYRGL